MAHPVARAAGRSALSTLLVLVLVPVVLAVVLGVPALLVRVLGLEGDARFVAYLVGALALLFTFAIGAIGFAFARTRVLDPGFATIGMVGHSVLPNIRHYTGQREGREMFATYARRGGILDLAIVQPTGATAAFTRQQSVGRVRELVGLSPLTPSSDPQLAGVISAGSDASWTASLLAAPGVAPALASLLDDPGGRELRWVLVRPGSVRLTSRWIDPNEAGAQLASQAASLGTLATACARLGPPASPIEENAMERRARESPMALAFAVVGCLLLALAGLGVLVGAIVFTTSRATPSVTPAPSDPTTIDPAPSDPGPRDHEGRGRRRRR
ncbi:MAG: hypothetical protein J0L92_00940 [Deltaproteobacteria bacterium]|nr:hypothetical protein [Deltaproteobacteria bacterium]